MNRLERMKRYAPADLLAIFLVAAMVFAAEKTGEKEIIFPEMAALSVGYLVAIKRSWMVNGRRMLFLITGCATLGVFLVRYVPLPLYAQVLLAFFISQILFMYSGTTFAPFVSAVVLPVLMQTTTWIYPISAFFLTLVLVLCHKALIRAGVRQDEPYVPVRLNTKQDQRDVLLRLLVVGVVGAVALYFGVKFVIAPPLLVAFTEFSRPRNKTRNKPVKTIALVTLCATIGAAVRFVFVIELGVSYTLVAVLIMTFALFVIHCFHMYMPPAGAIAILSLLIPEEVVLWFPVQIFVGITIFMVASRVIFMRRQNAEDHELVAE